MFEDRVSGGLKLLNREVVGMVHGRRVQGGTGSYHEANDRLQLQPLINTPARFLGYQVPSQYCHGQGPAPNQNYY